MKGILLASLCSLSIFLAMTVAYRLRPSCARVNVALQIWLGSMVELIVLYVLTPGDLGFLPEVLVGKPVWLDCGFSLFVLSASFFGGWLQLYNLTNRGYSLRMLIDFLHRQGSPMSAADVAQSYADGRGLVWMYDIRIQGLTDTGLADVADNKVVSTARGIRIAKIFRGLRALYFIEGSQK